MTPQAYNAARRRLGLTHEALAHLLGIAPQTSRIWAVRNRHGPDQTAVNLLKVIETLGVDEFTRILNGERK